MLTAAIAVAALVAGSVVLTFFIACRILTGNGRVPLTVRPARYGLAYEDVACRTADGLALKGWFIPAAGGASAQTILCCHGWGTNKGALLESVHGLARLGFNLLLFDFRSCGESEGRMLSVGYLEARDFDAAVAFMRAHRPDDRYAVFGLSMGAMVAFSGAARHGCFSAAVLEAVYRSHDEAVTRYLRVKNGVPYYPLVPMVLFWLRRGLGADPQVVSPERLASRFRVPVLAVCGELDRIGAPEVAEALLARLSSPKELWVVPGAGHSRCAAVAGPAYAERLAGFLSARLS